MSVRFIIGRGGTGKTHYCLTSIRETLAQSPTHGSKLVLLVPEQASLQMERALLAGPIFATHRAEVLSFQRLAFRILQAAGTAERLALSSGARAMVLRTLLQNLAPKLRYYRRVDRLTGFLEQLGHSVSELIEEAVEPDELRVAASEPDLDPQRAAKLGDLAEIYQAYLEYLGTTRLDGSQYLGLAREALPRCDYLQGARVWVDGFAGFTRQETLLLTDLARRAEDTEITALVDPEYHAVADDLSQIHAADLFAKPQRTYVTLRQRLRESGLDITPPLELKPDIPPRFKTSADLARLEQGFSLEALATEAASEPPPKDVYLIEAPDRRIEVDHAVAHVCKWVHATDGTLRYRDIAIIVRDLEPYHDLLTAALEERNVPFFIDRRRSIAHHPLVELLRAALAVVATNFATDSVRLLLKTDLLGLTSPDADELENYCLGHGVIGKEVWTAGDWYFFKRRSKDEKPSARVRSHLERVNAARRRVVEIVAPLLELSEHKRSGAAWSEAICKLLEEARVADQLEWWATAAEDNGDADAAAEHRQTFTEVVALLDDLADALGEMPMDLAELSNVIEAGLAELTLGLIPPTVDQLLVGSIERSRHPEIQAAIVLGFNDGAFPLSPAEDPILTDEDRDYLSGRDIEVGVTRRQRIFDEAMLAYVAATRPGRKLLITYAAADANGKALRPSPYIPLLCGALPGLTTQPLGDPFVTRATWGIMTARDLAVTLTMEMRRRPALDVDDTAKRQTWNDIYLLTRAADDRNSAVRRAMASLAYRNEAQLSPPATEQLIEGTYIASVSELETFAACPFQRFARYGLRLQERKEADLQPVDVGTVHHAILEEFINGCLQRKESFPEVNAGEVADRLHTCAKQIGAELKREGELSSARDAYILARSAQDLSPIVRQQQRIAEAGAFRPRATEKKFGFTNDPNSLPPLAINTPLGRKVLVRGLIDRVDLAELGDEMVGVVVDYKRTRDKRLDLANVFHGLSLQLLGYLLSLAEQGETLAGRPIIPMGAFYVSLLRKYKAVDHPDDVEPDAAPEESVPRGIFDAGKFDLLEKSPPAGWSKLFKIYIKKDGSIGQADRGDAASSDQFATVLDHTRSKIGELADGVLDGDVSVSPYRLNDFSPCEWCRMKAVCRFEFGDHGMRHLDSFSRSEVFDRLEAEE